LQRPARRLSGTRHWWRGFAVVFTDPLRYCPICGALYTPSNRLIDEAVVETSTEQKARGFRDDMVGLRDGFGAVVIASGATIGWTVFGPATYDAFVTVVAAAAGGVSLLPFTYFARKARRAKHELRRLRSARVRGEIPE
jgi:hypothetical protein